MLCTILRLVFARFQTRQPLVLEEPCTRRVFTPEESGPAGLDLLTAHLANVFAIEESPFSRSWILVSTRDAQIITRAIAVAYRHGAAK